MEERLYVLRQLAKPLQNVKDQNSAVNAVFSEVSAAINASTNDRIEILKFIADVWKSEIDINAKDGSGQTLIVRAVVWNASDSDNLEVLKFLTDVWKSEIDINAKDNSG